MKAKGEVVKEEVVILALYNSGGPPYFESAHDFETVEEAKAFISGVQTGAGMFAGDDLIVYEAKWLWNPVFAYEEGFTKDQHLEFFDQVHEYLEARNGN